MPIQLPNVAFETWHSAVSPAGFCGAARSTFHPAGMSASTLQKIRKLAPMDQDRTPVVNR
jgi:hypothetical protein